MTDVNQSSLQPPFPGQPWLNPPPAPSQGSYFSRSFNSNVVVVLAVLLFALVVAAFINTMARCVWHRRRPRPRDEEAGLGAAGREKGLEKNEIEALPVVHYGSPDPIAVKHLDGAGHTECVVCLSEFVLGEQLRLLPACHHGFHLACIDTWLLTHTSCPVCRCGVLSPAAESSDGDPACGGSVGGTASSARLGSSRYGSARIASLEVEIEASQTQDAAAGASTSRPKRSLSSILSAEAMANIIHGVGSRRFALRIQGQGSSV